MQPDLSKTKLHALQYQHVDGTFELTFGGATLLMGVCFYILNSRSILPNSFISNNLLPYAPLVVFVGGIYLMDTLVRRLRLLITYPRTGYIDYQKPQPINQITRLIIWIGIPVLTLTLLVLLFLNGPKIHAEGQDYASILMPSFIGLIISGLWMIVGWKISIWRYYLIAAVSLLVTAALFFNGVGGSAGMGLLFGVMGLALCVSGGLTLREYLRNNPPPRETADEL